MVHRVGVEPTTFSLQGNALPESFLCEVTLGPCCCLKVEGLLARLVPLAGTNRRPRASEARALHLSYRGMD